ncbi:MAG: TrmH family RNA methyltransferase [Anaerolineales bacterium]|nr:TrmH family RNA methyltransferase [Anaerolineales bacterium]
MSPDYLTKHNMSLIPKLKRYQKEFDHSYCFGVYPTLELLSYRPEFVSAVLLHSKGFENQGITKIRSLCMDRQIEIIENDNLVNKLASRGNTYAIGVFKKYHDNLDPSKNHVVLVQPSTMGNLGSIMRSMLGFRKHDLAIVEPAADPFDPKVIRASMGAVFQLRIKSFRKFTDYWGSHAEHTLYPLMTDGKHLLPEVEFQSPYAIIFGDEGSGLGEEYLQFGTSIRIPQHEAVDSLNLALAAGITLYHSWVVENLRE